jgi:hypothetical protein
MVISGHRTTALRVNHTFITGVSQPCYDPAREYVQAQRFFPPDIDPSVKFAGMLEDMKQVDIPGSGA